MANQTEKRYQVTQVQTRVIPSARGRIEEVVEVTAEMRNGNIITVRIPKATLEVDTVQKALDKEADKIEAIYNL